MSVRGAIVLAVLLVAVVVSGVQVVAVSHQVRRLHAELEEAQRDQDEHLSDYSRLLLERSALAAYQNVERIAEQELGMRFPEQVPGEGGEQVAQAHP